MCPVTLPIPFGETMRSSLSGFQFQFPYIPNDIFVGFLSQKVNQLPRGALGTSSVCSASLDVFSAFWRHYVLEPRVFSSAKANGFILIQFLQ
jgi:hypothetical protein